MPPKSDAERIAVVETKLESLDEKVDAHREESQRAHASTQGKIDQQAIVLARIEERMEAEAKARQSAAEQANRAAEAQAAHNREFAWTPAKVIGLVSAVGGVAAALGYGAPKAVAAAEQVVAPPPPAIEQGTDPAKVSD